MNKLRKLFQRLVDNGLFDGIEKVVLLGGHEVKVHKTPDGGLTIYSDYSEKQVMLSVHRYGKDHVGMGFPVADGTNRLRLAEDVLRTALRKLVAGELSPRPICIDRFREICNQSRIKPIGRFGFHMGAIGYMPERRPKTLDQWFKSKSNG